MAKKSPIVTIVGRQNVGKSTLFNTLIKEKKAIVDSSPGLTRDILTFSVNYQSRSFLLSDTPGLDIEDTSELSQSILENAGNYLKKSDLIILLLETPGLRAFDLELYDVIRKLSIPVIIAVNKMDSEKDLEKMSNFYEMGCSDILPISALGRRNINMLLDKIIDILPPSGITKEQKVDIKISLVGRPNSGKSTLLNSLIGESRAVVSEVPGTTRDSIDEDFSFHGSRIRIIDTAGLRRKSHIKNNIDFYSKTRTLESIKKSDLVIHLLDARDGITETDKKICDEIMSANKPLIIAINKWDLVTKDTKTFDEYKERVIFKLYRAADFPIISISAKDKTRIHSLMKTALEVNEKARRKIDTSKLNKILEDVQKRRRIPVLGDKLKVYYATQIDTIPPKFKFFVNNSTLFRREVARFFQKLLQDELDIKGVPVVIEVEGKEKKRKH